MANKLRNIWDNDFYKSFKPVPKWAYELSCESLNELLQGYSNLRESYKNKLSEAIVSVNVGKREVSVINTFFGGIQANFPGRVQNTGELSITFNEDSHFTITRILEYAFKNTSHNFNYFKDGNIKDEILIGYSNVGKINSIDPLEITVFNPDYLGSGNETKNFIVKYKFYNIFLISIQEEEFNYASEDETITRTARISYDFMETVFPESEEAYLPQASLQQQIDYADGINNLNNLDDAEVLAAANEADDMIDTSADETTTNIPETNEVTPEVDETTITSDTQVDGNEQNQASSVLAQATEALLNESGIDEANGQADNTAKNSTLQQVNGNTYYTEKDENGVEHTYIVDEEALEQLRTDIMESYDGIEKYGEEMDAMLYEDRYSWSHEVEVDPAFKEPDIVDDFNNIAAIDVTQLGASDTVEPVSTEPDAVDFNNSDNFAIDITKLGTSKTAASEPKEPSIDASAVERYDMNFIPSTENDDSTNDIANKSFKRLTTNDSLKNLDKNAYMSHSQLSDEYPSIRESYNAWLKVNNKDSSLDSSQEFLTSKGIIGGNYNKAYCGACGAATNLQVMLARNEKSYTAHGDGKDVAKNLANEYDLKSETIKTDGMSWEEISKLTEEKCKGNDCVISFGYDRDKKNNKYGHTFTVNSNGKTTSDFNQKSFLGMGKDVHGGGTDQITITYLNKKAN